MIILGLPVVPFCPLYSGVSLLKPKSGKRGILNTKGLLGYLARQVLRVTFGVQGSGS